MIKIYNEYKYFKDYPNVTHVVEWKSSIEKCSEYDYNRFRLPKDEWYKNLRVIETYEQEFGYKEGSFTVYVIEYDRKIEYDYIIINTFDELQELLEKSYDFPYGLVFYDGKFWLDLIGE